MNSDYHELMGVSRLLATAEERIEELETRLENSNDYLEVAESDLSSALLYIEELEEKDALRKDQKLEGMLADLEQMFLDQNCLREPSSSLDRNIMNKAEDLVEYLRSKGVVRLA